MSITKDDIPPEVVEAAAIGLYRSATHSPQGFSWATVHPRVRERWRKNARATILAALNAWPVAKIRYETVPPSAAIILPLPQSKENEG